MKRLPCLLALILAAFAPVLSAAGFEGIVQMNLNDGKTTHAIQYQVKDGYVRTDMQASGKTVTMIMDFKKQQMIMLIPGQNMYMTYPIPAAPSRPATADAGAPSPPSSSASGTMPQKTGATKTILGYTCTEYVTQSKGSSVEIWATDELGNFAGLGGGGVGGRGAPPPAWQNAIAGQGFFPLLVTGKTSSGTSFSLEVTSVAKQSLADSVFAPPAGAKEINLGSMGGLGGMMGGMMGGQRP